MHHRQSTRCEPGRFALRGQLKTKIFQSQARGKFDRIKVRKMANEEQLKRIAKELFWWQSPEISLANPRRFLMQVMTLGTWQEVQLVKNTFGQDAFKDALLNAQAGVFDKRSWAYWRAFFGLPEAEMPRRSLT
jgi:hypothetical protein